MRLVATALLVAGMTTAVAQPPGGGRGGFGFAGGGGGSSPAQLVLSKTVQGAIKVSEEQAGKLKTWSQDYTRKQFEGMKERFQDFQGLDPAERRKKMADMLAEINKKAYTALADVLKPEQVSRLKEIQVQLAGPQAFTTSDVQTALKLTDEQKDKLKDATDAYQKEARELRQEMFGEGGGRGGRPDPAKMADFQKKQGGLTKEFMSKVTGMLTADQKDSWKKLTGDAIDVAKVQQEVQAAGAGGFRKKRDD